ncbi:MAG TPA: alpha/beta fold hydrolase [Bacteroidales bacterium]|nr:alpha/beta fold hydrolase [Bacteroidales bacterium]
MKLFYRKYGDGPPLVILHGLYGSSDNWVTIAKNISNRYTVYLPDQRNHGNSPHDERHDYESMSDDLFELAADIGLKKFFLAGHSMGGKAAMMFSSRWPDMLAGMLIADISPFTDDKRRAAARYENLKILKTILGIDLLKASSRSDVETALQLHIQDEKVRELIMKSLRRNDSNNFEWKLNAKALLNNLDKIVDGISLHTADNQQITGFPVIFLKGENSDYIKDGELTDITRIFKAAELKTIKNAGHWLQADNPQAVTEELLDLIG